MSSSKPRESRPGPRTSDATATGAERCRIGRRWREGVPFGGHSREVENVPESRQGGGSGRRKQLSSRSATPTDSLARGEG